MAGMNMQQMMKQARKMQEQLAAAQENLKSQTVDASAGGGIHGKLFHIVFHKGQNHFSGAAGYAAVRIAAGRTESNTESLCTERTVGRRRQNLRTDTALTAPGHGTETATGTVDSLSRSSQNHCGTHHC